VINVSINALRISLNALVMRYHSKKNYSSRKKKSELSADFALINGFCVCVVMNVALILSMRARFITGKKKWIN